MSTKRRRGERGPDHGPRKGPRKGSALDLADGSRPRYPIEDGRYVSEKRAVVLLKASGKRTAEISTIVGVTERSINRWLQDGLADEVRRMQDEITEAAKAVLTSNALTVAKRLVKLTKTAGKEHGPRVKACVEALGMAGVVRRTVIEHQTVDDLDRLSDEELEERASRDLRKELEAELEAKGWRRPEAPAVVKTL